MVRADIAGDSTARIPSNPHPWLYRGVLPGARQHENVLSQTETIPDSNRNVWVSPSRR